VNKAVTILHPKILIKSSFLDDNIDYLSKRLEETSKTLLCDKEVDLFGDIAEMNLSSRLREGFE
jgi:hypothetical protein